MVVEEHMVYVAFNRMYCATYWFNPNISLHEKHYNYLMKYVFFLVFVDAAYEVRQFTIDRV